MDTSQSPTVSPPSAASVEIPLAVIGILCFAGAELAAWSSINLDGVLVPAVWPASGLLVGALSLTPRGRWLPAVSVAWAAMALSLVLHRYPAVGAGGLAAVHVTESVLAVLLVARLVPTPFDLSRPAHLVALAGAALLMPLLGGLAVEVTGLAPQSDPFLSRWLSYWLAGALGLFLAAPPVFGWMEWRQGTATRPARIVELAVTLVLSAIITQGIFGDIFPDVVRAPTYVLPVILWAVFRLGPGGTAANMFMVVIVGLWNTGHTAGPFALFSLSPGLVVFRAQGSAILTGLSVVLLAGMVAERRRITAELERAAAEIRTLRGFIPICAWCHKVRDDTGFWQGIELYLHSRTEATFSHSICPACAEREEHAISMRPHAESYEAPQQASRP